MERSLFFVCSLPLGSKELLVLPVNVAGLGARCRIAAGPGNLPRGGQIAIRQREGEVEIAAAWRVFLSGACNPAREPRVLCQIT